MYDRYPSLAEYKRTTFSRTSVLFKFDDGVRAGYKKYARPLDRWLTDHIPGRAFQNHSQCKYPTYMEVDSAGDNCMRDLPSTADSGDHMHVL